jgi:hypothetical protein
MEYLEADMQVSIEFLQMDNQKKSYLIIDDRSNCKTVVTGKEAEEMAIKIRDFFRGLFKERA